MRCTGKNGQQSDCGLVASCATMIIVVAVLQTNFDQQEIFQSSDANNTDDVPFALPSSSKWEVADRQDKMGEYLVLSDKKYTCL